MSRRLDISSLLNDDRPHPDTVTSGLDALVQAAAIEQARNSASPVESRYGPHLVLTPEEQRRAAILRDDESHRQPFYQQSTSPFASPSTDWQGRGSFEGSHSPTSLPQSISPQNRHLSSTNSPGHILAGSSPTYSIPRQSSVTRRDEFDPLRPMPTSPVSPTTSHRAPLHNDYSSLHRHPSQHSLPQVVPEASIIPESPGGLRVPLSNNDENLRKADTDNWFLEQLNRAPSSSSRTSGPVSPPVKDVYSHSGHASDDRAHLPKQYTMPDAASALEEELAGVRLHQSSPIAETTVQGSGPEVKSEIDRDIESALLQVAGDEPPKNAKSQMDVDTPNEEVDSLVAEMLDYPRKQKVVSHKAAVTSHELPMDVDDVEAELLNLVQTGESSGASGLPPSQKTTPTSKSSAKLKKSKVQEVESLLGSEDLDRQSMPPPATTSTKAGGASRKKAAPKGKVTASVPKQRAKAGSKPKVKAPATDTPNGQDSATAPKGKKKGVVASNTSRSRSTSVLPRAIGSVGPEAEQTTEAPEDRDEEQEYKLYCVCKTSYDEDKTMIACDRCDEWYHTQCVEIPDLEVDLVDQFFCPLCISANPTLDLCTTYKQRCLNGLKHTNPNSTKACHKPARGPFSKYCSDECGVQYMKSRIESWEKAGGKKKQLWEAVKKAEKREGVVVRLDSSKAGNMITDEETADGTQRKVVNGVTGEIVASAKAKVEREGKRLNGLLDHVVQLREELSKGMEVILWRERLVGLAVSRSRQVGLCGWDQRLLFGDEDFAIEGSQVLESYQNLEGDQHEWWCDGDPDCSRHSGWQKLREKDVQKEKELKEEALAKLTTREREIRKRIEDILFPGTSRPKNEPKRQTKEPSSKSKTTNGRSKAKVNGESQAKKSKKRKIPA